MLGKAGQTWATAQRVSSTHTAALCFPPWSHSSWDFGRRLGQNPGLAALCGGVFMTLPLATNPCYF